MIGLVISMVYPVWFVKTLLLSAVRSQTGEDLEDFMYST